MPRTCHLATLKEVKLSVLRLFLIYLWISTILWCFEMFQRVFKRRTETENNCMVTYPVSFLLAPVF